MCVSQTEVARLGSRGWGRGGPISPQGLAKGRGPEDSRPTLEAEGLGRTVLYGALLKAGRQPRPDAGAPRPDGCSHSRGAPGCTRAAPRASSGLGPRVQLPGLGGSPYSQALQPCSARLPPSSLGALPAFHIHIHHTFKSCSWVSSTSKTFPSVKRKAFRRMGAVHWGRRAVLVPAAPGAPGLGAPGLAQTLQPHSGLPWWLRH